MPLHYIIADKYPTNVKENLKTMSDYKIETIPITEYFLHITQSVKSNNMFEKVLNEL